MDQGRRRTRPGVGELAVRGQRRVRPRHPARRRAPDRRRATACCPSSPTSCRPTSWTALQPTRRRSPTSRASSSGAPTSRGCATALAGIDDPRGHVARLARRRARARPRSGSSAATAGPTTSTSAGSTTCWPRAATSTSSCSTRRSTPTPAARPRSRRRAAPPRSSRAPARSTKKKDLGLLAQAYGDVYVAQIALGANETQTVRAILEAAAWPGPSLILAYSTCIAHGIEMSTSMAHQKDAVTSGYWPLYRFHPSPERGRAPVQPRQQAAHDLARASSRTTRPATPRWTATDHDRAEHLLRPGAGRHRRALALLRAARRGRAAYVDRPRRRGRRRVVRRDPAVCDRPHPAPRRPAGQRERRARPSLVTCA